MHWWARAAAVTGLVATTLVSPGGPATAAGAGQIVGSVHINCFGCGASSGTGTFTFFPVPGGPPAGTVQASFSVNESACPILGTAAGSFSGAVIGSFTWNRYGTYLDIRTNGVPGSGVFIVTSPLGNPCGGPIDALVVATLVL